MFEWQSIIVGLVIALAAFYLAWGSLRSKPEGGACATGCGKCQGEPQTAVKRVVMVELQGVKRK